ncbi:MAG: hypothetical protein ABSG55_01860 [Dehalococcoidia bacterium]|jgi:hypothetical protein
MRNLDSALLTAQKSPSAVPYLQVQVRGQIGGVARLSWERLYSGAEADYSHAVTMPGDGSLIRARVDPSTAQVLIQRVASPGPGSNFAVWSALASVSVNAAIALASSGLNVLLFYIDTDGVTVKVMASSDYGQSFGSATTVATASGAVNALAAELKSDGTAVVIYSVGGAVYRVRRSGGSWSAATAWSNSIASVTGLACYYDFDFDVLVTGTDSSGAAKVWTAVYGDGFVQPLDTWSTMTEVARADAGSNVTFCAPSLHRADLLRLVFVEKYTGSQAYARPTWSHVSVFGDFNANAWREPVPFDTAAEYGMAITYGGGYVWLSSPAGVWRAPLSGTMLDVSEDVLEVREDVGPFDGRVRIVLRNDDGRYSDLTSGGKSLIGPSAQVDVNAGFMTSQGIRVSVGPRYWLEGWEYDCAKGASTFTLLARDGWWLLRHWRARRQYAWNAGDANVFQLLSFVFSRAGLDSGCLSSSEALTSLKPSFAIHPSEDGLTSVQRLLRMVPDVVCMTGETALILNPLAGDTATYAYGTDHAILSGRYGVPDRAANRVEVFGRGVVVDAFDWPSVDAMYDRLLQVQDLNLTTTADAQSRADTLLRQAAMASRAEEIVVPPNCGQELYDVVTVTDGRAGLDAAPRRVTGLSLRYGRDTAKPTYEMRLRLGAV